MISAAFSALSLDTTLARIVAWQTVGQLLGAAMNPYWRALEYKVNERTPNAKLSPADAATAVVRGFLSFPDALGEAAGFGVDGERFATMVGLAGLAPAPEMLAVALRRELIPEDAGDPNAVGFIQGIAQGNLANKWAPMIKALSIQQPSPEMALEALLEGQTDEATATDLYKRWGGDPQYFTLMYNTRGSAPTPMEAITLANRGIIPWDGEGPDAVSFRQAFLEGPWRNKWEPVFRGLAAYLPPPRTVTAMLRNGSLTDAQAADLYMKEGLSAELAQAYITDAHRTKASTAHELTRVTIEALYRDRVLTRQQAIDALVSDSWSAEDADYLLQVVDLALQQRMLNAVINRIHTLYTAHKITRDTAVHTLTTLGVVGQGQADVLALWDLEASANMRELTPAQIEGAFYYQVISQDEAQSLLEQLGYSAHDAWIALSVRMHAKVPNEPPLGVPGGAPGIQT